MRLSCLAAGLSLTFVSVCAGNSWHDDSHYVRVGPRTGYYVLRDGSQLSRRLGLDDSPYADTAEPLRHGYGKDVLAFRFDLAGRLNLAPAYIANAKLNEFYTRRIGSLIRTSLRE
ncbi:MAG TPA: hypothetical protein VIU85_06350, partial [Chthoniobacterales bacterium]